MQFARFLKDCKGGVAPMLALGTHPARRRRRRRRRLQPRQFGPHRHAGGARFDRADAVEGRPKPQRRATPQQGQPRYFTALFTPAGSQQRPGHAAVHSPAAGQLRPDGHRHAPVNTVFWRLIGTDQSTSRPPARSSGASRSSTWRWRSTIPARWRRAAR